MSSFGAAKEFCDHESSPDFSCSSESLIAFVAEITSPDWEDTLSTIVLSDSEEGLPKPKKMTLTKYFMPARGTTLPFGRTVTHTSVPVGSCQQSNLSLIVGVQKSL